MLSNDLTEFKLPFKLDFYIFLYIYFSVRLVYISSVNIYI